MKLLFFIMSIGAICISCRTTKHQNYFSIYGNDSSHTYLHQNYEVPIQVGDRLSIVVSALNPQSAIPYNMPGSSLAGAASTSGSSGASSSSAGGAGIVVEQDGKILYPQLGSIQVEGLTLSQVRNLLITRLRTYLTDPVVTVDFLNFKVTILGEVQQPKTITSPDGRLNILEALAQSGDLNIYAKKSPVMVIRENKGRRQFGYVNLLSNSIFSSPYYRLQQNDIIYVQAVENKPTVDSEVASRKFQIFASLVTLATTVGFFLFTFIINK